jgi:hypothetical protein
LGLFFPPPPDEIAKIPANSHFFASALGLFRNRRARPARRLRGSTQRMAHSAQVMKDEPFVIPKGAEAT